MKPITRAIILLAVLPAMLTLIPRAAAQPDKTPERPAATQTEQAQQGDQPDSIAPPESSKKTPGDSDATPADGKKSNWLFQIFGPGMWPLWLCSIILVALILERRRALRPRGIVDEEMIDRVADLMAERKVEEARQAAAASHTVLGRAWSQGLHEFSLGGTALDETLTNATLLAFKPLKKNLLGLATLGVISPLFGLLGTVLGMIITFHQIAATGGADKARLAGGIGLALFTTAGGLIVAIPAILSNRYFASRLTALAEQAEEAISRIKYRYAHAAAQAHADRK